ncbi:MAG: hypothetical protein ACI965_001929 [Paraglaciecola sp.]|jgi:hypothetical protein
MTTPFSYSTSYILDKSHFSETFDASITAHTAKSAYFKSAILGLLGGILVFFTEITPYAAWFIVGLSALEALSVRFRKPWWLARQMISKAASNELTLTIDENGVSSKSFHVDSTICWADITKIEQTAQGWLLYHAAGKSYLSGRCLSEAAKEFIRAKAELTSQ